MILAASFTLQCGSTIRSAHRKLRKVTVRGIEILTVLLLGVSKYEDQPFLTLLHFLEPVETPIYIPRIWNCQDDNFGLAMLHHGAHHLRTFARLSWLALEPLVFRVHAFAPSHCSRTGCAYAKNPCGYRFSTACIVEVLLPANEALAFGSACTRSGREADYCILGTSYVIHATERFCVGLLVR